MTGRPREVERHRRSSLIVGLVVRSVPPERLAIDYGNADFAPQHLDQIVAARQHADNLL